MEEEVCEQKNLSVVFNSIEDPRIDRHKKYPINEIIFTVLYASLLGVESWRGVELVAKERIDYLKKFFPFQEGIPSHQTIGRVFSLLKPKAFESLFKNWMAIVCTSHTENHIALDGKTLRGSFDKAASQKALHLLNAYAVNKSLVLAQLEVGEKTNEITTVPEMIDILNIEGAMVSTDALNTQKDIAGKIIDAKADYTLALKGNHPKLNESVKELFENKINIKNSLENTDKAHGRITVRKYDMIEINQNTLPQTENWKGLRSIGRVKTSTEYLSTSKTTTDERFYLLSYTDIDLFSKSARAHWGIESMHWILDVTFNEDASRKRKDHAPRNFSLVRKFALNIHQTFKGKLSNPLSKIKAALNPDYLEFILVQWGFLLRLSS